MVQCPNCKDSSVHESRWSSELARVLLATMFKPVRCYSCFQRFYTWKFNQVEPRGTRVRASVRHKMSA
jgi:hypothetical protein